MRPSIELGTGYGPCKHREVKGRLVDWLVREFSPRELEDAQGLPFIRDGHGALDYAQLVRSLSHLRNHTNIRKECLPSGLPLWPLSDGTCDETVVVALH